MSRGDSVVDDRVGAPKSRNGDRMNVGIGVHSRKSQREVSNKRSSVQAGGF